MYGRANIFTKPRTRREFAREKRLFRQWQQRIDMGSELTLNVLNNARSVVYASGALAAAGAGVYQAIKEVDVRGLDLAVERGFGFGLIALSGYLADRSLAAGGYVTNRHAKRLLKDKFGEKAEVVVAHYKARGYERPKEVLKALCGDWNSAAEEWQKQGWDDDVVFDGNGEGAESFKSIFDPSEEGTADGSV